MSINETEYRISLESLQAALKTLPSNPGAVLVLSPCQIRLDTHGEQARTGVGSAEIAKILDCSVEQSCNH